MSVHVLEVDELEINVALREVPNYTQHTPISVILEVMYQQGSFQVCLDVRNVLDPWNSNICRWGDRSKSKENLKQQEQPHNNVH